MMHGDRFSYICTVLLILISYVYVLPSYLVRFAMRSIAPQPRSGRI